MLHQLTLPLSRDEVRKLSVGDMVALNGHVTVSIGLPTHKRMVETIAEGQQLPVDLRRGGFFHLSTFVRESESGLEPLYMNPSTSTRYNAWMPKLIEGLDLSLTGGKGGLDAACVQALRDNGCAYLSFLGGGAPLLSKALRGVVSSHWNEYISQFRLLTLNVAALGPATVAIDAHGNSLYDQLRDRATAKMPQLIQSLELDRKASFNNS